MTAFITVKIADVFFTLVFLYVSVGVVVGTFLVMATEQRWRHPIAFTVTMGVLWPLVIYKLLS